MNPNTRSARFRVAAILTIISVVATTLSGCIPSPVDKSDHGVSVEDAFASSGIAIIKDVSEAWPEGALMASPAYAVSVMQSEIDSGGGMPGADIDELVPMPAGAPPFSFMIAAWLSEESTSRAQAARTWFPESVEWVNAQSIWYPRAALLLFVADAMEASIADFGDPAPSSEPGPSALAPSGSDFAHAAAMVSSAAGLDLDQLAIPQAPCSTVSNFFAKTINQIFSAVQLPPDFLASKGILGAISGFLAGLFNSAVKLAQQAVMTVIKSLTGPALRAIASGVAIVGVASHLSSYLLGVSMTMVASESPVKLQGQPGSWFGLINANRPLEAQLNDCLSALGQRPLPDLVREGAPISWRPYLPVKASGYIYPGKVLNYPQGPVAVEAKERIVIPWVADTEKASNKPVEIGTVRVRAEVPRAEVSELFATVRNLIEEAIKSVAAYGGPFEPQVEALVRAAVGEILLPIVSRIEAEILGAGRSILVIVGSGVTTFEYREPDDPTPPPGTPVPNCYLGEWRFTGVSSRWLDLSRSSFQRFSLQIGPDGSYSLRVVGWAVYEENKGGFWTTYEGATQFKTAPGPNGTWAATASRLKTVESNAALYVPLGNGYSLQGNDNGEFGEATFSAGLRPTQFGCSADGLTLTITGESDPNFGPAIWTFRRM